VRTVKLVWYSHRYGGKPENLARAKERFAELTPKFASRGQTKGQTP
jgi:hypothetical protein